MSHAQVYDPSVLLQVARSAQAARFEVHSFISTHSVPALFRPGRHVGVDVPVELVVEVLELGDWDGVFEGMRVGPNEG